MPIDPRIALQGRGVQVPNLVGMMGQVENVRDSRLRRKNTLQQMAEDEAYKASLYNLQGVTDPQRAQDYLAGQGFGDRAVQYGENLRQRQRQDQSQARQQAAGQRVELQDVETKRKRDLGIVSSVGKNFMEMSQIEKEQQFPMFRQYLESQGVEVPETWSNEWDEQSRSDVENAIAQTTPAKKKGPLSLSDKIELMNKRYGLKGEFETAKEALRRGRPLTAAQRESISLGYSKLNQGAEKLANQAKELGMKEDKAEREAKKFIKSEKKQTMATANRIADLESFSDLAGDLMGNTRLNRATGGWTYLPTLRGGKTADIEAQLKTFKAKSAISTLSKMKSESSTGASGMGALSERELDVLIDAYTTLQTFQSVGSMRKNLKIVQDGTKRLINAMKQDGSYQHYNKKKAEKALDQMSEEEMDAEIKMLEGR